MGVYRGAELKIKRGLLDIFWLLRYCATLGYFIYAAHSHLMNQQIMKYMENQQN